MPIWLCHHCDSNLLISDEVVSITEEEDGKETRKYFCDESCCFCWQRDDQRPELERNLKFYTEMYEDLKEITPSIQWSILKKLFKVAQLYTSSLLQRKPRDQLIKLRDLYKQSLCDMIEYEMEEKNDHNVFWFGNKFKAVNDYDHDINVWCKP